MGSFEIAIRVIADSKLLFQGPYCLGKVAGAPAEFCTSVMLLKLI